MPAAEVDLTVELVRSLVAEQFPDLLDTVEPVANGWDNGVFRLGAGHSVRLPRRAMAAPLVEHEQRWLPLLADAVPLPIPVPVRAGRPSAALGYPWSWSICPWFEGTRVAVVSPPLGERERAALAEDLGSFLAGLWSIGAAPADAPANPYRGVPLAARDGVFRERVERLTGHGDFDAGAVVAVWDDALAAPPWSAPPRWVHGDLHPANVLVEAGPGGERRVSAVLDFGDLTAGDPATDLATAWMFLPTAAERERLRAAAGGADDALWRRARGWAVNHGVACLEGAADEPVIAGVGARTVANVLADA